MTATSSDFHLVESTLAIFEVVCRSSDVEPGDFSSISQFPPWMEEKKFSCIAEPAWYLYLIVLVGE